MSKLNSTETSGFCDCNHALPPLFAQVVLPGPCRSCRGSPRIVSRSLMSPALPNSSRMSRRNASNWCSGSAACAISSTRLSRVLNQRQNRFLGHHGANHSVFAFISKPFPFLEPFRNGVSHRVVPACERSAACPPPWITPQGLGWSVQSICSQSAARPQSDCSPSAADLPSVRNPPSFPHQI